MQSYNPGNLASDLQRHADEAYGKFATTVMHSLLLYPPVFGAYTELFCGLSKDLTVEKDQGVYIVPWGREWSVRKDIQAETKDGGKAAKLYDWCEEVTKKYA